MKFSWRRRLAFLCLAIGTHAWSGQKRIVILHPQNLPFTDDVIAGIFKCVEERKAPVLLEKMPFPSDAPSVDAVLPALVRKNPDMLLTIGNTVTKIARDKLPNIPSVYCMVADPVANNIPGEGVTLEVPPNVHIDFIHANFPALKRIAVIYSPERNKRTMRGFEEIKEKGQANLTLISVNSIEMMTSAVASLHGKADVLLMVWDPTIYTVQSIGQVILQTLQMGIPFIAVMPSCVKAGALGGVYADFEASGHAAADIALRALEKPAAPGATFTWPAKLKTAVNLVVAERLGTKVGSRTIQNAEIVVR